MRKIDSDGQDSRDGLGGRKIPSLTQVGSIYKIIIGNVARTIMDSEYTSDIYKSRTQIKKASEELQKLGERLIELSPGQIKSLDIPEELRAAILDARQISAHKASQRNRQFIGALMRQIDPSPVLEALDRLEAGLSITSRPKKEALIVSPWVETILESNDAIETFLAEHPSGDRQQIRQLRRNALKKRDSAPTGKEFKDLATCIQEVIRRA